MNKRSAFPALLFLLIIPILYSDETRTWDEDALFVITGFEFDITGRTREDVLITVGEFQKGEEIRGKTNFHMYIQTKIQLLLNQRVLRDTVEVTYTIGDQQLDGAYPVILKIAVEDSWNILAFPVPRYNSNTGLDLMLRIRDYNFLGSLNPLRIDIFYRYDQFRRSSFNLFLESITPFRAFGYNWNFRFDTTFGYRAQAEDPFHLETRTGLSMELPLRHTTLTVGFQESFNLNKENLSRHWEPFGYIQRGFFMSSMLYALWEIPTGFILPRFGELTYIPSISATFNHRFPAWPLQDIHRGPFLDFTHSLGIERISWHGNYREGTSFLIRNSYRYDFFSLRNNENPVSANFEIIAARHFIIQSFFGISLQLQYRHWFYHYPAFHDLAGDAIRGIADASLSANYMLSFNSNFPLRLPLFAPSRWFDNDRLWVFDIEFHLAPLVDMALFNDPRTETSFRLQNAIIGGGLELMIFPAFMRNLYMRVSVAWNLREATLNPFSLPRGYNREIVFTMRHFF